MYDEQRLWQIWSGDNIFFNCTYKVPDKEIVFKQGDIISWEEFVKLHDYVPPKNYDDEDRLPRNRLMCTEDLKSHDPDFWQHQRKAI